jgi:hypothetical protein
MANYLDGIEGGKHNSDNITASFSTKQPKEKIQFLSPDGFEIEMGVPYYTDRKEMVNAFIRFKNQFKKQGYYSSAMHGQIPLNDLITYCQCNTIV